jgi:two-component system, sensor histidine kinase and response regulator
MARVLVADDVAANRELLRAYLEPEGHEVIDADSGTRALELARTTSPDLVLLDVMMPGSNGFEVGAELKRLTRADDFLPIVLVTALRDPSSRDLGLKVAADEYLTKPVERGELLARVRNLLALRARTRELAERNRELMSLQKFQAEMAALLVHDLKNPMAVIMSNLEYVLDNELPEDQVEALEDARRGGQRVLRLLTNLLDLTRLESSRMPLTRAAITIEALIEPLLRAREQHFARRGVVIEKTNVNVEVVVDADLITRVAENILDNAARYVPEGGRIAIFTRLGSAGVDFCIGNSGDPIAADKRAGVFEKYGQGDGALRGNLGLGLYFCRLALEAHGGRIAVEEHEGLPTVFVMRLPPAVAAS